MPETFSKAEVITGFARRRRSTTEQQYLEALPRDASHRALERLAPAHEEAAQRVRNVLPADQPREPGAEPADERAPGGEIAEPTALGEATADHDVHVLALKDTEHARQQRLVVLATWRNKGSFIL
jgi:hypothetical protein